MRPFLTCSQGHRWPVGQETWSGTAQEGNCPVCREARLQATPASVDAETQTQALPAPAGGDGVPPASSVTAGEVTTDSHPTGPTPSTAVVPGYEILRLLGRGGMGVVYEAREVKLNRIVAVKMLKGGIHAGDSDRARFRTEAEAIARLQHPNVVQIYDVGEAGGCPYLSLEFCAGGTLAARLAGKPLPALQAAGLAETLGRALHYCHQRGVLHRDLKPANVLLTVPAGAGDPWGEPKITDFGLAKQLEGETGPTQTGALLGTPGYMAPEQAGGKVREVGPLTDVYLLGATLYEMLTGRPPFQGDSQAEVILKVINEDATPPSRFQPRLPRDLETVCLKALAKEPSRRYHSVMAMVHDLERFQAGEPILGRREGLLSHLGRRTRRAPALVAALAALALAVALGVVLVHRANAQLRTARHLQEVADLTRAIEEDLLGHDWSAERLRRLDERLGELEALAPGGGEPARLRRRLVRRFGDDVGESYSFEKTPVLERGDVARIEASLDLLAAWDPERAGVLRKEFRDRCGVAEVVLDLKAALKGNQTVFPGVQTRAEAGGEALVSLAAQGVAVPALTRVACRDKVSLEAGFAGWETAPRLGLLLNAAPGGKGYAFLLVPAPELAPRPGQAAAPLDGTKAAPARPPEVTPAPATLGASVKDQKVLRLEILRDGVPLRSHRVAVGGGPLHLRAERQGDRLRVEVRQNQRLLATLECQDLFSFREAQGGVFGLSWAGGVRLTSLRAQRHALPGAASPLERGDGFYAQKKFEEALAEYRQTPRLTRDLAVCQEGLCKEALCLTALGRSEEAAPLFEKVAAAEGKPWPLIGACQLWPIYIRQKKFAEADVVFHRLSAHFEGPEAAVLMPEETRGQFRAAARSLILLHARGNLHEIIKYDPQRAENLNRALAAETFLQDSQPDPYELKITTVLLMQGYRGTGQAERAARAAQDLVADLTVLRPRQRIVLLTEYAWLMTEKGTPGKAVEVINRSLMTPDGRYYLNYLPLLVVRAQLNAAQGRWKEAEDDLELLFHFFGHVSDPEARIKAYLVRGFLRERRRDPAGAVADWRLGWAEAKKTGATLTLEGSMVGALADEIDEAEAKQMLGEVMGALARYSVVAALLKRQLLSPAFVKGVLCERWRSPRGRGYARRIAYRQLPYMEHCGISYALTMYAAFHQGALPERWTAEQEGLAWDLALDMLKAYSQTGKFTDGKAIQGVLSWTGSMDLFGWRALSAGLDKPLRGPIAYVLGHRMLRIKQPADAVSMFKTARSDAPPGSTLRRLAQAELDRLKAK